MRTRTRGVRFASVSILVLTTGFSAGCSGQVEAPAERGRILIVTRAPAGAVHVHPEPDKRFPSGSQLAALELSEFEPEAQELSRGLASAGNPSITIDGQRVIFIGRENGSGAFSLFSSAIDGSDRRRLVGEPFDCGGGAELPDGRIVFAAKVEDALPPPRLDSAWGLFVLTPDGGDVQRITFSGQTELDPYVLNDGRILYSQWLPGSDGRSETGSFALFTVHPDGTGAAPLHGYHEGPDWKLRPRQAENGDLFFVKAEPGEIGRVAGSLWTAPAGGGFSVVVSSGSALSVEPVSEDRLLIATLPALGDGGGLLVVDRDGRVKERITATDAEWDVVDAVEVRARHRPQGQLSMIDPGGTRGYLLAIDARPDGPLGSRATKARLRIAGTVGAGGDGGRDLGEIDLAEDGSFFAAVPADVPLLLDVLDADGETLVETVTPIWVRPKEIRGCIGCHEDPETAPPNRRPLAVLEEPVDLVGEES